MVESLLVGRGAHVVSWIISCVAITNISPSKKPRNCRPILLRDSSRPLNIPKNLVFAFVAPRMANDFMSLIMKLVRAITVDSYLMSGELVARYAGKTTDLGRNFRNTPFHLEAGMRPRYYQEVGNPPILAVAKSRGHVAVASIRFGVRPPLALLGRS